MSYLVAKKAKHGFNWVEFPRTVGRQKVEKQSVIDFDLAMNLGIPVGTSIVKHNHDGFIWILPTNLVNEGVKLT